MNAQQRNELATYFPSLDSNPVGIYARVYRSTDQSINTATLTAISFDTERYDRDNLWAAGSPTRLTCTREGMYLVWGGVRFASNATGGRAVQLRYNGTLVVSSTYVAALNGDPTDIQAVTMIYLTVGTYMELLVYQTSGGALNVQTFSAWSPEFAMQRVS